MADLRIKNIAQTSRAFVIAFTDDSQILVDRGQPTVILVGGRAYLSDKLVHAPLSTVRPSIHWAGEMTGERPRPYSKWPTVPHRALLEQWVEGIETYERRPHRPFIYPPYSEELSDDSLGDGFIQKTHLTIRSGEVRYLVAEGSTIGEESEPRRYTIYREIVPENPRIEYNWANWATVERSIGEALPAEPPFTLGQRYGMLQALIGYYGIVEFDHYPEEWSAAALYWYTLGLPIPRERWNTFE